MKVRIFQPIVPEYRVALFNGVGRHYGESVEIWASAGEGQDQSYPLAEMKFDYSHEFRKLGPFRWQRGLSVKGLVKGDVIVICGDVHQVSSLWVAWKAKCRGIGVVWWGHHVSYMSKAWTIAIRLKLTKWLSDVVLCYTKRGIDWFKARGWEGQVFATGNTLDLEAVKAACAKWPKEKLEAFQVEKGFAGHEVILFCSVLRYKAHVELLLQAMATEEMRGRDVRLVVIGDGEARSEWEALADELGLAGRVIWVGALREQEKLAPWFLSAKAYVYPGPIGLSLIHAFAYGLPVVCHNVAAHHGPEIEAMVDGETGYEFKEGDAADFARQIGRVMGDEVARQAMAKKAQTIAFEKYGIETMISNYCAAVDAAGEVVRGERND